MTGRSVVVGVSGGIAAYKACELIRRLTEGGDRVTVLPTAAALRFVGAATFEALSGHPVATDVFTDVPAVTHVALGRDADLVVIAPASADLLARAATGRADDLLTATLLVTRAPVLFAPAMHTEMWTHPATTANVAALRARGAVVVDPAVGRLTGADSGPGRLPEPEHLAQLCRLLLDRPDALPTDLAGRTVVVTAGGTREPLDPVRFLGNRSSGKQGYALALVAAARGARVILIAANTTLADPPGVRVVRVGTAVALQAAVVDAAAAADAVLMAAAVADHRPAEVGASKRKKAYRPDDVAGPPLDPDPLPLLTNPDILAELVAARAGSRPLIVGFAAETGDADGGVVEHGRAKLARKGVDLLVVNDVSAGRGFEVDDNAAVLLSADGRPPVVVPTTSKTGLAAVVLDQVTARLG